VSLIDRFDYFLEESSTLQGTAVGRNIFLFIANFMLCFIFSSFSNNTGTLSFLLFNASKY